MQNRTKKVEKTTMLEGVLIDTLNNTITQHSLPRAHTLGDIYTMLNCDLIDVISRKFGNNYYDIYCDDEGLFKETRTIAIVTIGENEQVVEQIVNNCFIVKHDGNGNMETLTDEEIKEILHTQAQVYGNKILVASL